MHPQARTLLRDALKYKLITHSVELTTDHVERANKRPVPIYASTTQKPRKYVRYSPIQCDRISRFRFVIKGREFHGLLCLTNSVME